jgi:chromate transporter
MIPLIQRIVVEQEHWLTYEAMLEIIIIAESTPGPVSLNVATFVGFKRRGVLGSLFASMGLAIPSLVIIYLIAIFFDDIKGNTMIAGALSGIKTAIVILVTSALMKLIKLLPQNKITFIIIGLLTLVMFTLDMLGTPISGILFIIAGALIGLLLHGISSFIKRRGNKV